MTTAQTAADPAIRILATYKGETGYLHTEVDLDFKIRAAVTMDQAAADTYSTRQRAERMARKLAGRFEHLEVVEEPVN